MGNQRWYSSMFFSLKSALARWGKTSPTALRQMNGAAGASVPLHADIVGHIDDADIYGFHCVLFITC